MRLIAALSASSFVVLALLTACSSDDANSSSSSTGGPGSSGTNGDGGTLPGLGDDGGGGDSQTDNNFTWTLKTNIAHYKVYASRDEAIAWYTNATAGGETSGVGDKAVASSDARYADVDKEVADIFQGFKELFPVNTQDLPTPIVILTESANPGAYAVYDDALKQSPNVFMIQTPTLALDKAAVRGVIAHELTHHVLKHKWPGIEKKIEVYYDATKTTGNGFGFEQTGDQDAYKAALPIKVYGESTGDFAVTQWNGYTRPEGTLYDFVQYIHDKAKKTNAAPCADAETAENALKTFADPLRDRATFTIAATPEQLTQLGNLTTTYVQKETACVSVVAGKFYDVIGEALGQTADQIKDSASTAEKEANDATPNAYAALVYLTKKYDQALIAAPTNLRIYTYEEQADDTAVSVNFYLDQDPNGLTTYFRTGALDAAARTKCDGLVSAGEPPYGGLADPHHATCWRVWHTQKINAFLKK